mmetsp:Transcript_59801/g.120028  ORF Transcript_59801/g.120028 Transcript_59801/m.120028 type:complete len:654 (-) Transcript_59801:212-2173(-)
MAAQNDDPVRGALRNFLRETNSKLLVLSRSSADGASFNAIVLEGPKSFLRRSSMWVGKDLLRSFSQKLELGGVEVNVIAARDLCSHLIKGHPKMVSLVRRLGAPGKDDVLFVDDESISRLKSIDLEDELYIKSALSMASGILKRMKGGDLSKAGRQSKRSAPNEVDWTTLYRICSELQNLFLIKEEGAAGSVGEIKRIQYESFLNFDEHSQAIQLCVSAFPAISTSQDNLRILFKKCLSSDGASRHSLLIEEWQAQIDSIKVSAASVNGKLKHGLQKRLTSQKNNSLISWYRDLSRNWLVHWVQNQLVHAKSGGARAPCCGSEQHNPLLRESKSMLQALDLPPFVGYLEPSQAIHAVQSGSFLYDLSTSTSDVDYSVVFLTPSEDLYCSVTAPPVDVEHHVEGSFGSDKSGEVEFNGTELQRFTELLIKGNPKTVEQLFISEAWHAPLLRRWPWQELVDRRHMFLTRTAVAQYFGWCHDRIRKARGAVQAIRKLDDSIETALPSVVGPIIEERKHQGSVASKLFYHALVKLFELRRMLRLEAIPEDPEDTFSLSPDFQHCSYLGEPLVHSTGREREFILKVRKFTGSARSPSPFTPAAVLLRCETYLNALRSAADGGAADHLPEETEWAPLAEWLFSVRVRQLYTAVAHEKKA